jgi:signal transduction histidine kinase
MKTIDSRAFQYQEILFSIIMSVVAMLSRGNPLVVYPDALWAFLAILGFNLAYHMALRWHEARSLVPVASVATNVLLISWALWASGGWESRFWPMYLLPIFTACLYLGRRHVWFAMLAAGGFLSYFHLEALWHREVWQVAELVIKLGVLAVSAAITAQLSFKERDQRSTLQASREKVERLAAKLDDQALELERAKSTELSAAVPRIVHNLNNPLAVIIGSAELMLKEAPEGSVMREDLERIQRAARACVRLGQDLSELSRGKMALAK